MNIISDVETLYGSVHTTWKKIQADVISHIILFVVVFIIFRITWPNFLMPEFEANKIQENEWYKLAKETGVLYLSFIIPFLIVIIYGSVIRGIGRILVTTIMIVFPTKPLRSFGKFSGSSGLMPLAIILKKENFEIYDLLNASSDLIMKYQIKKNEIWQSLQRSIKSLNNNATIYLGNFSVFMVAWIMIFRVSPGTLWIMDNQPKFWSVLITLFCLVVFSGYRVYGLLSNVTKLQLYYVSLMIKADPEMEARLDIPVETKQKIRDRLDYIIFRAQDSERLQPSFSLYFRLKYGYDFFPGFDLFYKPGLLFPKLYKRGRSFSENEVKRKTYYDGWFKDYLAYRYYKLSFGVHGIFSRLWQIVRFYITGGV